MSTHLDYESRERRAPGTPWWKKPHPILLLILALLCAWSPALWLGVGTSPCFLFVGAIFVAIVADRISRRSDAPLRVVAIALALILLFAAATSYWTSHPSADRMFKLAFGIPPPVGVSQVEGRAQWNDGLVLVVHFKADDSAMQQLIAARPFEMDQSVEDQIRSGQFDLASASKMSLKNIVDSYWKSLITGTSGRKWEYQKPSTATLQVESVEMFRNEKGEVWVVYSNGG